MTDGPWRTEMEGSDGGAVKTRAFSWQSNSRRTTLHPLFPLHLDFRWPTLCWVVTLETALRVFIKRDCGDMEKRSSRQDVVHDNESTHGGRAKKPLQSSCYVMSSSSVTLQSPLVSFQIAFPRFLLTPAGNVLIFPHLRFEPGRIFKAARIWITFTRSTLVSSALRLIAAFFSCILCQSVASANVVSTPTWPPVVASAEKVNSIVLCGGFEADYSHFISLIPII